MSQENQYSICVLLAVWGEKFIADFLRLSLPSLLASGNLPALTKSYNTRMVFLTRPDDISVFETNLAFQKLKTFCEVEFISIEDLLVFGNYSTTLTLAYDRAIKQTGAEMLNTYFVFLTSDYIMANGSMEGLMRYIQKGYSAICAGNFQVIEEEIAPLLNNLIDPDSQTLDISPRELIEHSIQYLHPVSMASFFEQGIIRNYRANRFFLRHDYQVIASRFYLLHMLCIKPETMNYKVGSSCDYSFVPEMAPSGKIGVINDSDDYLVIEIQPKEHELDSVSWGHYDVNHLATALSEWTTKQHRENSQHTIYYHSRPLTEADKNTCEQKLSNFISTVNARLNKYEIQPHVNHPYWLGAIQAFKKQRNILKNNQDYEYLDLTVLGQGGLAKRLFYKFFGPPPDVYSWHHRWLEYRSTKKN